MSGLVPRLPPDERIAIELLDGVDQLEPELLHILAPDGANVGKLRPIDWDRVGEVVYLESWQKMATQGAKALFGLTPALVPTGKAELAAIGKQMLGEDAAKVPEEIHGAVALHTIAAATACVLVRRGWQLEALPGEPVIFRSGEHSVQPFAALMAMARAESSPAAWLELHTRAGISDEPLEPPAPSVPAA
jgi:hypothetical protein